MPPVPREKAVLFCPTCWYEAPVDGDWGRRPAADSVTLVCPECDADVTTRPRRDAPTAPLPN